MSEVGGWTRLWLVLSFLAGWAMWLASTPDKFLMLTRATTTPHIQRDAGLMYRQLRCDKDFTYRTVETGERRMVNIVVHIPPGDAAPIQRTQADFPDGSFKVHDVTVTCRATRYWPDDKWLPLWPGLIMLGIGLTLRWILQGFFARR